MFVLLLFCLFCTYQCTEGVSEWTSEDGRTVVRLRNPFGVLSKFTGRVEICVDGLCGSICDHNFSRQSANVVCKMLGSPRAKRTSCCSRFGRPPLVGSPSTSGTRFWLDAVRCKGDEDDIFQCTHLPLGRARATCTADTTVGVACRKMWASQRRIDVRLHCPEESTNCSACPSFPTSSQIGAMGFVQVFLKETRRWHYVSAERWGDNEELSVLCGQLGFPAGLSIPSASDLLGCDPSTNSTCGGERFQREAYTVTMRDVDCEMNHSQFQQCSHYGFKLRINPSRKVATALCGYTIKQVCSQFD